MTRCSCLSNCRRAVPDLGAATRDPAYLHGFGECCDVISDESGGAYLACKTGGFQANKLNYFNDLRRLRYQFISLFVRAGTGIELSKQTLTQRSETFSCRYLCACSKRTVSLLIRLAVSPLRDHRDRSVLGRPSVGRTPGVPAVAAILSGMPYQRGQFWIRRSLRRAR